MPPPRQRPQQRPPTPPPTRRAPPQRPTTPEPQPDATIPISVDDILEIR